MSKLTEEQLADKQLKQLFHSIATTTTPAADGGGAHDQPLANEEDKRTAKKKAVVDLAAFAALAGLR